MAKLKMEVTHEAHQRDGIPLRDRLFANVETLYSLGSTFAPVSNWATNLPGSDLLTEKVLGIASERDLPRFKRTSFQDWAADRSPQIPADLADRKALVIADPYTNYTQPEVGKAAVSALEAAGVHVEVSTEVTDSGRPAHSKGMIDHARATATENVENLAPRIADGWDVVSLEPSDATMYRSDYLDLLAGDDVERVAANTYDVMEYLDRFDLLDGVDWEVPEETLAYHGHCHQTAIKREHHAGSVLEEVGYGIEEIDSTCCGMAGSFGYEAEHYSMSMAIGDMLFEQVRDSSAETVVAPGTSCRSQLLAAEDRTEKPPHPIQKVAEVIPGQSR